MFADSGLPACDTIAGKVAHFKETCHLWKSGKYLLRDAVSHNRRPDQTYAHMKTWHN